jgi:hypothetical protein
LRFRRERGHSAIGRIYDERRSERWYYLATAVKPELIVRAVYILLGSLAPLVAVT